MAKRDSSGFVGIVRGINERLERAEEKLSELEKESTHFAENVEKYQAEIDKASAVVIEAEKQIGALQDRRQELQDMFLSATFNEDGDGQNTIKAERAALDKQLDELQAKKEQAEAKRNQLSASIATARENTWETLDAIEPLDDEQLSKVIDAVVDGIRAHRQAIWTRMDAIERNVELPSERAEREQAQKQAEQRREAAEKAAKRQELIEQRNFYAKLLSNVSHRRGPLVSYRPWLTYLEREGIEHRIESSGETTFFGTTDEGKRTFLNPHSILADVRAEYIRTKKELGEEVEDFSEPYREARKMTRASAFESVM